MALIYSTKYVVKTCFHTISVWIKTSSSTMPVPNIRKQIETAIYKKYSLHGPQQSNIETIILNAIKDEISNVICATVTDSVTEEGVEFIQ